MISIKSILLLIAPIAFAIVSRPSFTSTVAVPSIQRLLLVGAPFMTGTLSAFILKKISELADDRIQRAGCENRFFAFHKLE